MGGQNKDAEAGNIFTQVRAAFAGVAAQAVHVRIDTARIPGYAAALAKMADDTVYDTEHHFLGSEEQTAAYVLILDSINFGGPSKPDLAAEGMAMKDGSLYFTVALTLKKIFDTAGGIAADRLAVITADEFATMMNLPCGPVGAKLATLYAQSLRELGTFVRDRHDGQYLGVVEQAGSSAARLVETLARLPSFNDVFDYKGARVPLLKRAQITAADLHLSFGKLGKNLFADIGQLTMFPDNAVAHVLHQDGILVYTPALEKKVEAGTALASGSIEEIEIRACTGHAVELLKAQRPDLTAMNIDHILWHRSHEPAYRGRNHHKTLSPFY